MPVQHWPSQKPVLPNGPAVNEQHTTVNVHCCGCEPYGQVIITALVRRFATANEHLLGKRWFETEPLGSSVGKALYGILFPFAVEFR